MGDGAAQRESRPPSIPCSSMRCYASAMDGRRSKCSRKRRRHGQTTTRGCGAKRSRSRWSAIYSGALPKLKDQLDNTKNDDQPLLFVAIQVLFKMHQQDKSLSPDNLAAVPQLRRAPPEAGRTRSRARRNLAARGPRTLKPVAQFTGSGSECCN